MGSGASSATVCSIRCKGKAAPPRRAACGWANRLHHTSSAKPSAQVVCTRSQLRSGGRGGFFSRVLRIGTGNPLLGALPANAQAQQRRADGFARDYGRRQALGTAHLGGQIERPEAGRISEGRAGCGARAPATARRGRREKARGGVWCGREEPRGNASSPCRLNAMDELAGTVFSSQPTSTAICGARSPRALANTIWQRRTSTPSDKRRPVLRVVHSSSVSARTRSGLIPPRIPHSDPPSLRMH